MNNDNNNNNNSYDIGSTNYRHQAENTMNQALYNHLLQARLALELIGIAIRKW